MVIGVFPVYWGRAFKRSYITFAPQRPDVSLEAQISVMPRLTRVEVCYVLLSTGAATNVRFDPDPMKVARNAAKIQSNPDERKAIE